MNKLIDEMVFDTKKSRWIFLTDLDSGEFYYNNKLVKVFTTDRGYKFFQTKWVEEHRTTTISNISWERCKETVNDRIDNKEHYRLLEQLSHESTKEYYNNKTRWDNYTGD
tara:strand:+ start:567 stop:896 length:330 start_codon:yes stop_codon:yes gene_type:complete